MFHFLLLQSYKEISVEASVFNLWKWVLYLELWCSGAFFLVTETNGLVELQ